MTIALATVDQISETDKKLGPLSGITVLDFSHVLVRPHCNMVMADLDARVIKIERALRHASFSIARKIK